MSNNVAVDTIKVRYEGKIDLAVKNNSHTIAYDLIEINSQGAKCKILEVGCSTGYFGQALKDAGHDVWGIEMTPDAAQQAKNVLDFVYVGTIEAFLASEFAGENKFDYIVFGDVLEHLPYPSEILEKCRAILSTGGGIIASIPNVTHLAVRIMLLEGRWEYSKLGIMDDTHLRFFDKQSILSLFNQSGYFVQSLDCVRVGVEQTGININQELYKQVHRLVHDDAQDVFQYVVLTRAAQSPEEAIEKTNFYLNDSIKILCVLPIPDSSLAKIRILGPLRTWANRYNGELRIRELSEFRELEDAAWADVVVFQREANVKVLNLIKYFKKLNIKVIFDLDDLLHEIPSFLTMHEHSLRTRRYLLKALQMSDAVTVTNQRLKNELVCFNSNTVIIPNCSSIIKNEVSKNETDETINILIASSDTIQLDFIIPVLKKLVQQTEFKFNLIGIGAPGKFIANAGIAIELYENMSHEEFKKFLVSLNNTIGLIPLDDSKFSSCKSAIKFVDYSLSDVVSVCSFVPPYSDTVINGQTGILVNNDTESWYAAILMLAKSETLRSNLTKSAKQYCLENFALERSAETWQELFLSLGINKKKVSYDSFLYQLKVYRLKLILSHIFNKSSYFEAIKLIKKYGLVGFTKRFLGYLKSKNHP